MVFSGKESKTISEGKTKLGYESVFSEINMKEKTTYLF